MPGYALDIDIYTRHWMWANGDRVAEQDAVAYVKEKFGYKPEESKFLKKGKSMYHSVA